MKKTLQRLAGADFGPSFGPRRAVPFAPAFVVSTLAFTACGVHAQSNPDPVVVTATRTPVPLSQVLADVTVVERDAIERQGAVGVADVLRRTGGFELSRNGGPGTSTNLFLRGAASQYTVVLVDGVRVDTQSGSGGAPWEAIPLAQIDHIEILRGPASAVYGSDGIAGVVQIFTRQGEAGRPVVDLGLGAGTQGTAKGDASIRGAVGEGGALRYALAVAGERSKGLNIVSDPASSNYQPDRDGYQSHSLNGTLGYRFGPQHQLDLTLLSSRIDAQYDSYQSTDDDHSVSKLDSLRAAWTARWTSAWQSQLSVEEGRNRYRTAPSPYDTRTRTRNFAWQNTLQLSAAQTLSAVLERREDQLDNSDLDEALGGRGDRHQDSLGLGYGWQSGDWSLEANGRYDDNSAYGGHTTGALAAGYALGGGWRASASAGTAFRSPTLYQLYSVYGTPGLEPETSRNVEAGLQYREAGNSFGATVYRNRIENLIDYDFDTNHYGNLGRAALEGLSLRGETRVAAVNLSATADFQRPHDEATGLLLPRRARRYMNLRADTELAGWTVGAEVQATAKRFDNAANTRALGGYALWSLDAQVALAREWRLLMRLDNAFDRDNQTARYYNGLPRTAFVSLRWTPSL